MLKRGYRYLEKRNDDIRYIAKIIYFRRSESGKTLYVNFSLNGHLYELTETQFNKNYKLEELQ